MSTREIGQLNPVGVAQLADLLEIEQGGVTFSATINQILALATSNLSSLIIDADKDWLTRNITNVGNFGIVGFLDIAEIATPVDPAANVGRLYSKDLTGVTTLFYRDSSGVETNLFLGSEVFSWTANHDANSFALEQAKFADGADNTKIIDLNLSGMTTGIVLTISSIQSTAQTLTIPNISGADVFVTENLPQTLANKTITTPTIADFSNSLHDHQDAAGGGQLDSTLALSDTVDIAYLNTPNVYIAGQRQDFLGLLAGTAGINVGAIGGNPTVQVDGDIWYNSATNTLFGRINGADVDLGQFSGEVFVWTANHSFATFNLIGTGTQVTSRINLLNADEIGWENNAGTANLTIRSNASDDFVFSASFNRIDFNLNPLINAVFDVDGIGNQIVQGTPVAGQYLRDNGTEFIGAAIVGSDLPATVVQTDQTNTYGDFAQIFPDDQFFIQNPAASASYQFIASAIAANRTVTLPLLTTNDIFVMEAFAQTLTNKTLGAGTIFSAIPVINDGITFTFNPNLTVAGINVGQVAGEPSSLINGDIFYDSVAGQLKGRINGITEDLGGPPFSDNLSIVEGTSDATKELRFEVDGNASGVIGVIATIFTTVKTITIPDATDTLVGKATVDNFTNKTFDIDATGNILRQGTPTVGQFLRDNGTEFVGAALVGADLPATVVQTDQANTFGAFAQRFPTNQLQLDNPAQTFVYIFATSAIIAADKIVTLPLLTADDTFVFEAFPQALTNKTIDGDLNTISNINETQQKVSVGAAGTVLTSNGVGSAPTYQAAPGALPPFADNLSIVEGDGDPTKQLRLEVDGNTTAIIGVIATIFTTAKTITIPDATDTLVGKATTDVLTNKSIDLANNTLTGTLSEFNTALSGDTFVTPSSSDSFTNKIFDVDATGNVLRQGTPLDGQFLRDNGTEFIGATIVVADLPPEVVNTGKANNFGNFNQTFLNSTFRIRNPAETFNYVFRSSAITADINVDLPLLIANDVWVFEAHIQTLTNKVIDAANNTITNIGASEVEIGIVNDQTVLTGGIALDDELLIYDASLAALRKISWVSVASFVFSVSYNTELATNNDFSPISGNDNPSTGTEINVQVPMPEDAVLRRLGLHVNTNTEAGAVTWKIRINGADGNLTISIPAATTGFFQDVSNSDVVSVGDLVNYQVTGVAATFNFTGASMVGTIIA